jgi:hypothetical protein
VDVAHGASDFAFHVVASGFGAFVGLCDQQLIRLGITKASRTGTQEPI